MIVAVACWLVEELGIRCSKMGTHMIFSLHPLWHICCGTHAHATGSHLGLVAVR